jgi:hypothetical protein
MKYQTTAPSRYFERQRNQAPTTRVVPAPRRTHDDDYGVIVGFVFVACFGFSLGMVLAAAWAGVL